MRVICYQLKKNVLIALSYLLVFTSTSILSWQAQADEVEPILESAMGQVVVIEGEQTREATSGETLKIGSQIKVSANSSARLVYPDESEATIADESEVQIETEKAKPLILITRGELAMRVQKNSEGEQTSKSKFYLKTKTAVVGVRGTEFVFAHDNNRNESSVHMLQGQVFMGRTVDQVASGQGMKINQGQSLRAGASGLGKPQSFNRQEFLNRFQQSHPSAAGMQQRERPQFQQLKQMRNEGSNQQNQGINQRHNQEIKQGPGGGNRPSGGPGQGQRQHSNHDQKHNVDANMNRAGSGLGAGSGVSPGSSGRPTGGPNSQSKHQPMGSAKNQSGARSGGGMQQGTNQPAGGQAGGSVPRPAQGVAPKGNTQPRR